MRGVIINDGVVLWSNGLIENLPILPDRISYLPIGRIIEKNETFNLLISEDYIWNYKSWVGRVINDKRYGINIRKCVPIRMSDGPPVMIHSKKQIKEDWWVIVKIADRQDKIKSSFKDGMIIKWIGPVNDFHSNLEAYFQRINQLYRSIKPIDINKSLISSKIIPKNEPIEVFSIDPPGCIDIDDAFSYDLEKNKWGVHIAFPDFYNHPVYLSSIYLPTPLKTVHMMEEKMLDYSLLLDKKRRVISYWFHYDKERENWTFDNYEVNFVINKNPLSYDSLPDEILEIMKKHGFDDSHLWVEFWMKTVNSTMADLLYSKKCNNSLYRGTFINIKTKNKRAIYNKYPLKHLDLEIEKYCHSTSPLRRWVDSINQYTLIEPELLKSVKFEIPLLEINAWDYVIKSFNLQIQSLEWINENIEYGHEIKEYKDCLFLGNDNELCFFEIYDPDFDLKKRIVGKFLKYIHEIWIENETTMDLRVYFHKDYHLDLEIL